VEFGGDNYIDLASRVARAGHANDVQSLWARGAASGLRNWLAGADWRSVEGARSLQSERAVERAAIAALESDRGWVADHVNEAISNRSKFRAELAKRGMASLESSANFVLVLSPIVPLLSRRLDRAGIRVVHCRPHRDRRCDRIANRTCR